MKKIVVEKRRAIIILSSILYIVAVLILNYMSYQVRVKDSLIQFGDKAMLVAIDLADRVDIEKEEYDRLLALDFPSLLEDEANIEFENHVRNLMQYSDIRYIYMISLLEKDQVKYQVEQGEEMLYEMPVGTPLDVVYLLDAVASDKVRVEDTEGNGYKDKDRYMVLNQYYKEILSSRAPSCLNVNDRWGNYVTGYAPVRNKQGDTIGYLCVDLLQTEYLAAIRMEFYISMMFTVFSSILFLFLIYLYNRYLIVKKIAKEKTYYSDYDTLTSVYSRRRIFEVLNNEWERCINEEQSLSILFIDLDNFKAYNDLWGHQEGDKLLCKIVFKIKKHIDKLEGYVGRYGGDEFIVVLGNRGKIEAEKAAKTIINEIQNTKMRAGDHLVTISIGVKEADFMVDTIDSAIALADSALYEAKGNGKNSYYTM